MGAVNERWLNPKGFTTDAKKFKKAVGEVFHLVSEGKITETLRKWDLLNNTKETKGDGAWRSECVRLMLASRKVECSCYMARTHVTDGNSPTDIKVLARIPIAVLKDADGKPVKYVWIETGNKRSIRTHDSDRLVPLLALMTERFGLENVDVTEYYTIPYDGELREIPKWIIYDSLFDDKIRTLYNSLKNHGRRKTGTIIETDGFMNSKYGNDASFSNYIHRTLTAEGIECHCYFLSNHSYDGNARYVVVASSPYETFDWIELAHRKEMGIRRFNDSDTMFNAMAKLFGIPDMEHYEYIPHKGSKFTNATEQPIVPSICKAGEIG